MRYSHPDEHEFVAREFGLIDSEERYFSYVYIQMEKSCISLIYHF